MNNSRMTLRQLANVFNGTIYIKSVLSEEETLDKTMLELTNRLKGCSGVMSMEVFEIYYSSYHSGMIAVLDIPAEWLERMEG